MAFPRAVGAAARRLLLLGSALAAFGCVTVIPRGIEKRTVEYASEDGRPLLMDIYLPPAGAGEGAVAEGVSARPAPVIVHVHGGAWFAGARSWGAGVGELHLLARRGFVVASIDYRLAPRYRFPAPLHDLCAAIAYLRANSEGLGLDPLSIGLFGTSAGGHIVSLFALAGEEDWRSWCPGEPPPVKGVVDMFGPTDLPALFRGRLGWVARCVFGDDDPGSSVLIHGSPALRVSGSAPPFLLIQGDHDELVPPEQSELLYSKLREAGVSAELILVRNAGHALVPSGLLECPVPSRREVSERIVAFFERTLR